jgi:hypothetical protein
MAKRGRPIGASKLTEPLIDQFCELLESGVRFADAAPMLGISVRSAYAWRERGQRIEAEYGEEWEAIPTSDRIYLHFLHRIDQARSRCVVWLIGEARRQIRSTSDALKFLEYVCSEEFGQTARRKAAMPSTTFDLNVEIRRILSSTSARNHDA